MSGQARANWFLADVERLAEEEPDPFDAVVEVGKPIDLEDREGFLQARLSELGRREHRLQERAAIKCAIKEMPGTCCSACPISEHAIADSDLGRLCRVSREQEAVWTELSVFDQRRDG